MNMAESGSIFEGRKIDDSAFMEISRRYYDNIQCASPAEFEEDLRRFGYIRKLFSRYQESGEMKERLVINHIITIINLFGSASVELMFYKIPKNQWYLLASYLSSLNIMPNNIKALGVNLSDLCLDHNILDAVERL